MMASVLSSDGKQDPDVLAANATSAALMLSDIPWGGPIGMIRIGRICGQFVVNPTMDEVFFNIFTWKRLLLHPAVSLTRANYSILCVLVGGGGLEELSWSLHDAST